MNPSAKAAGLQLSRTACRDRLHELSPANVHCRVGISGSRMPARLAEEVVPTLAVGSLAMPALRTRARRVARINELHGNPANTRLVLDKVPEFGKRPFAVPRSLRSPNGTPLADACEIFEADSSSPPKREDSSGFFVEAPCGKDVPLRTAWHQVLVCDG